MAKGEHRSRITVEERDALIAEIDVWANEVKRTPSTLGGRALRDCNFYTELRKGRRPLPDTVQKLRDMMAEMRAQALKVDIEMARRIARRGGVIPMIADRIPDLEQVPPGVQSVHIDRMIARGWLAPSGDAMFGAASQTVRLTDMARIAVGA